MKSNEQPPVPPPPIRKREVNPPATEPAEPPPLRKEIPVGKDGFPTNPEEGDSWGKGSAYYTYTIVAEGDPDNTGYSPGTGYWKHEPDEEDPGHLLHPEDMGSRTND